MIILEGNGIRYIENAYFKTWHPEHTKLLFQSINGIRNIENGIWNIENICLKTKMASGI